MAALLNSIWKLKMWRDTRGQELVEVALLTGFMVCACGTFSAAFASNLGKVFSKVTVSLEKTHRADLSSPRF
jgi:pilus assembly protein Flp/PilA